MSSIKSGFYSILQRVGGQIVAIISLPILTRLIPPEAFGDIALVLSVNMMLLPLLDFGLTPAYVKLKSASKKARDVFFTINLFFGTVHVVILGLSGPILAYLYGNNILIYITIGVVISIFFNAINAQSLASIVRSKRFDQLFIIKISAQLIGAVGAIILAYNDFDVAALVIKILLVSIATLIITRIFDNASYSIAKFKDIKKYKSSLSFGFKIVLSRFMNALPKASEQLIVGKLYGNALLGHYSKAYDLAGKTEVLRMSLTTPAYSYFARLSLDERKNYYLLFYNSLVILIAPLCFIFYYEGDHLIRLYLGNEWSQAAQIFQWMGLYALGKVIYGISLTIAWLENILDELIKISISNFIIVFISTVFGFYYNDIMIFVIVLSVLTFVNWLFITNLIIYKFVNAWSMAAFNYTLFLIYISSQLTYNYLVVADFVSFNIFIELAIQLLIYMIVILVLQVTFNNKQFVVIYRFVKARIV